LPQAYYQKVCRKTGSVYGSAEFEAIKGAPLIKSRLTAGERPKRMMLQTANTEERAESGPSLRLRDHILRLMEADIHSRAPAVALAALCLKGAMAWYPVLQSQETQR
jgi:hypothetical protein